ncbi:LysR Transcriptional regulator [Rhabdaerophilaceae bacterium]
MSVAKSPGRREGEVTLSGLRIFVAVAEARSFSEAAAKLGVSQPTVSIQLAALEQACGVLLLHRKPQLALTDAGQDLFARARLVISRANEFVASAQGLRDMQYGQLSIGLSTPHTALPIIAAFMQAHPEIQIATGIGNTAELLDQITRCRIDIGIMTLMEPPPQLACALVSTPRLLICLKNDDPLAVRPSLRPAEISDRPFVMREEGSMTRAVLEAAFAADNARLNTKFVLGSREAVKVAVASGMGLGAVFENEMGQDLRLRGVPLAFQPKPHGVYAVTLKDSLQIPAVRAFIDKVPYATPS